MKRSSNIAALAIASLSVAGGQPSPSSFQALMGQDEIDAVAISPDSRLIATAEYSAGDEGSPVEIWDLKTGRALRKVGKSAKAVVFSPDSAKLLTGDADGALRIWDAASGRLVAEARGHEKAVTFVAYAQDGKRIVSGS